MPKTSGQFLDSPTLPFLQNFNRLFGWMDPLIECTRIKFVLVVGIALPVPEVIEGSTKISGSPMPTLYSLVTIPKKIPGL